MVKWNHILQKERRRVIDRDVSDDFSIRLSQNGTVKELENHHRDSWGHVEQESGGVYRKQLDLFFFMNFLICPCTSCIGYEVIKSDCRNECDSKCASIILSYHFVSIIKIM